ncbi:MAG: N-formylglutamate amidohydrolase [Silicimonas sp.]|nr:N-formylglutamate amidohydrolase [Silicimonas sp.]
MAQEEDQKDFAPVVVNPHGTSPVLLVCEHASAAMPAEFGGLGLDAAALESHIAWDPGALETARLLSARLDAPLVHANASRLLYDCNRPPEAAGAMPVKSETTEVPGNIGLSDAVRAERVSRFYRPFETLLSDTLDARSGAVMVTIHSFTPVYFGKPRPVEIGVLHDSDARMADALLEHGNRYLIARNEPYGPQDGVTHTLTRHALPRGLHHVMIEIRNDLIATTAQCETMARWLADWLKASLADLPMAEEAAQ